MPRCILVLLAMLLSVAAAQAAQVPAPDPMQGDGRVSPFYTWEGAIPETPGRMLRTEMLEPTLGLSGAGAQSRILYTSTDGVNGRTPVVVSGAFFAPKGTPPAGGWPLIAWAHETAGMADICAPSWFGHSTRVAAYLNAWLEQGFAIVATDYQGLGTPGPHPYPAVRPAAFSLLDSIRAVRQAFPAISDKVVLVGFSQGAAAAFGASALQPSYAPDLGIRGAVVTGLPYLTPETVRRLRQGAQRPGDYTLFYTFYIGLLAQQADPRLKGSDMFSARAVPLFERSRTACIWQMVLEVLGSGLSRAEDLKPGYMKALMANLPLLEYPTLRLPQPIFIGIGAEDRDTPAGLQQELVKEVCAAGTTVEAHLYAGTRHDNAVARLLPDSIRFVEKVMAGEAITPVCQP